MEKIHNLPRPRHYSDEPLQTARRYGKGTGCEEGAYDGFDTTGCG